MHHIFERIKVTPKQKNLILVHFIISQSVAASEDIPIFTHFYEKIGTT